MCFTNGTLVTQAFHGLDLGKVVPVHDPALPSVTRIDMIPLTSTAPVDCPIWQGGRGGRCLGFVLLLAISKVIIYVIIKSIPRLAVVDHAAGAAIAVPPNVDEYDPDDETHQEKADQRHELAKSIRDDPAKAIRRMRRPDHSHAFGSALDAPIVVATV